MTDTATASAPADLLALLRRWSLAAVAFLIPFETAVILVEDPGVADGYNRLITVGPLDLALLLFAVTATRSLLARRTRPGLGGWTMLVLTAAALFALPFHPTMRGLTVVIRLALGLALVLEVQRLDAPSMRKLVVYPLLGAAAIQTAVSLGQLTAGGAVGLRAFGERAIFHDFGGAIGVQGTTLHPYILAGFAMTAATIGLVEYLGSRRWPVLAGVAVAAVPLGLTYSRMAFLGVIAVAAALVWGTLRDRQRYAVGLAVFVAAIAIPSVLTTNGWADRAGDTASTDLNTLSSSRITRMEESFDLMATSPLVGIGPGQYTNYLEANVDGLDRYDAVHTVPLLAAAEDGVLVGIASTALLILLGLQALRSGPAAVILYGGFIPFVMLDKFPYLHPNGLVMMALWLGAIDLHQRRISEGQLDLA